MQIPGPHCAARRSLRNSKSLCLRSGKDFFMKGGEYLWQFQKSVKKKCSTQYQDWLKRSQAVILVEYTGANMKVMDATPREDP